jgi:hypothetical protein
LWFQCQTVSLKDHLAAAGLWGHTLRWLGHVLRRGKSATLSRPSFLSCMMPGQHHGEHRL